MRFTGRGHGAVRATHAKTLELVPGDALTERGTCIVAVGAEAEPARPLAGPVRIRIATDGHRFSLDALANPSWTPGDAVVIRRGPLRLPGTFATDASAAAADLPRELVAALQDPDALVTVDVVPAPTQPVIVLFAADSAASTPPAALAAELDRADEVIVEDSAARRLAGTAHGEMPGEPGGRTLVVATAELPGRTCPQLLATADLDTVGLPPLLAVAAACPSRAPLTFAEPAALRAVPAAHRLVLSVRRADLPDLLQRAAAERGSGEAIVMQEHGRPLWARPGAVPDLAGADTVACCLVPVAAGDAVDPAARAAVTALLADGVPTKTAAKALAALTGWERRRAYDEILRWPAT